MSSKEFIDKYGVNLIIESNKNNISSFKLEVKRYKKQLRRNKESWF